MLEIFYKSHLRYLFNITIYFLLLIIILHFISSQIYYILNLLIINNFFIDFYYNYIKNHINNINNIFLIDYYTNIKLIILHFVLKIIYNSFYLEIWVTIIWRKCIIVDNIVDIDWLNPPFEAAHWNAWRGPWFSVLLSKPPFLSLHFNFTCIHSPTCLYQTCNIKFCFIPMFASPLSLPLHFTPMFLFTSPHSPFYRFTCVKPS